jgi:ABC-type transport system involved in cytochrome c biogenesis permease component
MIFLPVAERELRVAARHRATYRLRFLLVLIALGMWFILLVSSGPSTVGARGKMLFIAVGVLVLGFALLAGIFLTADCLSEEKREGTLGLLFLTPLKAYDVVFGKLMATSLHAFYGLLGVLPLLALPLLMGGVTVGEFWRVTLVLLTTLLLSLAIGILVSAFSHEARQAISGTLLILLVLTAILPGIWWIETAFRARVIPACLRWTSPVHFYWLSFDSFFNASGGHSEFLHSWYTLVLLTVGALAIAAWHLPRAWQQKGEGDRAHSQAGSSSPWRFGSPTFRASRRWLLETNPAYWLATRDRLPRFAALSSTGVLTTIWICALAGCFSPRTVVRDICFGIVMLLGFGIHQLLKTSIAMEASRRLSEDKRSGALELLLVSPLKIQQIVGGIRSALLGIFAWPVALAFLINLALLFFVAGPNPLGIRGQDRALFCEMYFGGAIILLFDVFALTWMGMAMGLTKAKHPRAIMATLGRIMLFPWLGILFFMFLAGTGARLSSSDVFGFIFIWLFGCALLDMIAAGRARATLVEYLRNSTYEAASARALEHALDLKGSFEPAAK